MSMIQVDEARELILSKIQFKGIEKISINECLGRILREDIIANRNNPPLDNSAMDGYALITEDILAASPENPIKLHVAEEVAAGYASDKVLQPGQAEIECDSEQSVSQDGDYV